jgi:Ala-tRNA(Pro) deacylase
MLMTMAATVRDFLDDHHIRYDVVTHPRTGSSLHTASLSHIPASRLAKAVILEDEDGMVMAVVPASRRVQLGRVRKTLGRNLGLASEDSLVRRFPDCALGAVPPLGTAYGLETVVDDELESEPEVYFEAGDHEALVRVEHDDFTALMRHVRHAPIAQVARYSR